MDISDGVTLTVAPGTRVEFQDHYRLGVQGRILAVGSPQAPIVFTSANPELFGVDSTLSGAWNGLRFERTPESNGASRLEHCIIEYCKTVRDTCMVGPLLLDGFSKLRVVNSILRHNVADYGGAVHCSNMAAPRLTGCLFTRNQAFKAGSVLWCLDSCPQLINCTLSENQDINPEPMDPAMAVTAMLSKPRTLGSILWENGTNYFLPSQLYEAKGYYTRYCDIQGGYPGKGNFDRHPNFLGTGEHPFSLGEGSPCANAGPADTTGMGLPPLDLAGIDRIRDHQVDMGAYEGNPVTGSFPVPGPAALELSNHPNPFNPGTEIRFVLEKAAEIQLAVFDLQGRRLRTLLAASLPAGAHRVVWDGTDSRGRALASGLYHARLREEAGRTRLRKMLLLK